MGAGEVGSDICDVRWKLAPKVKGGYTAICNDPKAPQWIFFSSRWSKAPDLLGHTRIGPPTHWPL